MISFLLLLWSCGLWANDAVILEVTAMSVGTETRFDVTILHSDTGWDHYADGWGIYTSDGELLGYRTLFHPHVDEQPFTRSLTIKIPDDVTDVLIIPHDSMHGEGKPWQVNLK